MNGSSASPSSWQCSLHTGPILADGEDAVSLGSAIRRRHLRTVDILPRLMARVFSLLFIIKSGKCSISGIRWACILAIKAVAKFCRDNMEIHRGRDIMCPMCASRLLDGDVLAVEDSTGVLAPRATLRAGVR